jgi:hypothetical protein
MLVECTTRHQMLHSTLLPLRTWATPGGVALVADIGASAKGLVPMLVTVTATNRPQALATMFDQ